MLNFSDLLENTDWPKDGILRVEIVSDPEALLINNLRGRVPVNLVDYMSTEDDGDDLDEITLPKNSTIEIDNQSELVKPAEHLNVPLEKLSHLEMFAKAIWPSENYIVEYSLEYGNLNRMQRILVLIRLNVQDIFDSQRKREPNSISTLRQKH